MRKILLSLACLAFFAACQESIEKRAERDARQLTEKKCPMPISSDGNVILERAEFDIPTRTWKEELLLNLAEDTELADGEIRELLINELRNSPSYKPYMDNGFNFHYIYRRMSNPKDTLIDMTLTKEDYK